MLDPNYTNVGLGVENVKTFLCELRYRLVACRWQEWNFHIQNSDTFSMYRTFCTVPGVKELLENQFKWAFKNSYNKISFWDFEHCQALLSLHKPF